MTVLPWGRLSDRIGRKPIILAGLSGVSLSVIGFGSSTSFAEMLAWRAIGGGVCGNAA